MRGKDDISFTWIDKKDIFHHNKFCPLNIELWDILIQKHQSCIHFHLEVPKNCLMKLNNFIYNLKTFYNQF